MRRFRGVKILATQDEYEQTNVLKAAIKDLGFHVLLTCVPLDSVQQIFPRSEFPNLRFEKALTGYVPDHLIDTPPTLLRLHERPIVIGYRARALPAYFGRLGQEKYEIGRRMAEICEGRGIPHDISMEDSKRIYGSAWLDFIGSCRAMIGSETGSNVFDWDGSLRRQYNRMVAVKGRVPTYEEFLPALAGREKEVFMGEISPRIFECAVMKTPLILFRGRYSDAIQPESHFIPLEKDFSNIDEVLSRIDDIEGLEAMAERAYQHLVLSGRFGYRAFGEHVRSIIEQELTKVRVAPAVLSQKSAPVSVHAEQVTLCEKPTSEPQAASIFELKRALKLRPMYLQEIVRLEAVFDRLKTAFIEELERLDQIVEAGIGQLPSEAMAVLALRAPNWKSSPTGEKLRTVIAQREDERTDFSNRLALLEAQARSDDECADRVSAQRQLIDHLHEHAKRSNERIAALREAARSAMTCADHRVVQALIVVLREPAMPFALRVGTVSRLGFSAASVVPRRIANVLLSQTPLVLRSTKDVILRSPKLTRTFRTLAAGDSALGRFMRRHVRRSPRLRRLVTTVMIRAGFRLH
jgi:hypothetical protein